MENSQVRQAFSTWSRNWSWRRKTKKKKTLFKRFDGSKN